METSASSTPEMTLLGCVSSSREVEAEEEEEAEEEALIGGVEVEEDTTFVFASSSFLTKTARFFMV